MSAGCVLLSANLADPTERMQAFGFVLAGVRELMLRSKYSFDQDFINPHLLLDVLVHVQHFLPQPIQRGLRVWIGDSAHGDGSTTWSKNPNHHTG